MELNTIYNTDCLGPEGMDLMPDKSIDMVLCDLPYGTTECKWDTIIPFKPLWEQYERIIKDNGAIVLTASQPFTSALVMSNYNIFRYSLVYEKSHATGHLNANKMPMRKHEDILVFYKKLPTYNPQKKIKEKSNIRPQKIAATQSECYGAFNPNSERTDKINVAFPDSVLKFNNSTTGGNRGLHPTQKPVALFEYLIKTYTNPGETVLDNCMGSGTTAIACLNTDRNFVGFEKDPDYYLKAQVRIQTQRLTPKPLTFAF
jgi:site-specific DNA-methyltransferase (adenine-specific)